MKLIALLLTTFCMLFTATLHSQDITLSVKNVSMQEALNAIEKQTDYRFVYVKEQIEKAGLVTMDVKQVRLETALIQCFEGQPLSYVIEDRLVIVRKKEQTKDQPVLHDVKGRVTNKEGTPLAGITVRVKGKDIATATDGNGEFNLKGISPTDILIFSGAEVETREVGLNGGNYLAITLAQKVNNLDETIIIGYGTTTKRYNVGSVTKVSSGIISTQPVANPLSALQDRVPGLLVTQTSGVPGSSVSIQIRGQNTLNPNPMLNNISPRDNPLFIIDGVPFAPQNDNINQFNSLASPGGNAIYGNPHGGISAFNSINPADIESIEVLRDADATSIYGSRGSNGVILITTKKGKAGKTNFSGNVYKGWSSATRTMQMLTTEQYLAMRNEAFKNDGIIANITPGTRGYAPDIKVFDSTAYTNWEDYFLGNTASTFDANAKLTGGSLSTQFLIGAGFHKESYILPGDFSHIRGSFNLHLNHATQDKKFNIEISANYSTDKNNSANAQNALTAFTLPPNHPDLLNTENKLRWDYDGVVIDNKLAYLKRKYSIQNSNLIASLNASYQITPGLKIKSNVGYSTINSNEIVQVPKASQNPIYTPRGSAGFGNNNFVSWIAEPQLEYRIRFLSGTLITLLGGTLHHTINTLSQINGSDYANDALLGSPSAAGNVTVQYNKTPYKYVAGFARLNYILQKKYILNLNARRDGSSRFGPGRQFGNFGSAGAGWIFSEESYIKKIKPISYGKLRASYGITGNDNIGDYQYIQQWLHTGNQYNNYEQIIGYIPGNLYNPDFSWSSNKKLELAVEIGLLKDRIIGSVAWYRNRSSNELVTYNLPSQTGFSGVTANFPAVVENKGWEIDFQATPVKNLNFQWTTSINLSFPKNRLVRFPGMESSSYATIYVIGQSVNVLNKFKYLGVDPATGIYLFDSKNGPTSTPTKYKDDVIIGDLDPDFFGGWSNSISYKSFSIQVFINFRKQWGANYLQQINNYPPGSLQINQPSEVMKRWQNPGDITSIQKFTSRSSGNATSIAANRFTNSSGAYSDASFIRLKTVSISYGLPKTILSRFHMQQVQMYMQSQNLVTITGFKGNDPETQSFYGIPPLCTIVIGLLFTL
ncbi:SusC/RagA family TonB-linked outer membrane protein [Agriterribacter sp.]|uniref:SusC/RagA family TonB-linked outer membrane protein n=1 Tax=Agriterribacter sp. TaxID=2821509 RepID=UPI002C2A1159|nr:SusC/RagA family TonB-linked outer membrane protein [Agriterribacter sp.]HRO46749.1 SusC/RagA family TonB-linked outer membrane protein [Agriterribacter sp.]